MSSYKIGVVVGSLRKESFTLKIARELMSMGPESMTFELLSIGQLPLYNQDLESSPPEEWRRFRDEVRSCDGFLFATPEYNRSMPGLLKNAIDVASRPYGDNAWDSKPSGIVSVSPGAMGAFGANHHLRQSLVFVNVPVMPQPEAYIGNVANLLGGDGKVSNDSTRAFLQKFMVAFADWVTTHVRLGSAVDAGPQ